MVEHIRHRLEQAQSIFRMSDMWREIQEAVLFATRVTELVGVHIKFGSVNQ